MKYVSLIHIKMELDWSYMCLAIAVLSVELIASECRRTKSSMATSFSSPVNACSSTSLPRAYLPI